MTTEEKMDRVAIPLPNPRHQHWAEWALEPVCQSIIDAFDDEPLGSEADHAATERFPIVDDDGTLRGPRLYLEMVLCRLENEGAQLVNALGLTAGARVADKTCAEIEGLMEILSAGLAR